MSLKERVYSVLIVSASPSLNVGIRELLPASRYFPVVTVSNLGAAKRAIAEREFDFVIINSPLPDGDGLSLAIDAGNGKNTVVLLTVRAEQYPEAFDLSAGFGVFLLKRPLSRTSMELALGWLTSARERLRMTENRVQSVEEKMEEIRLINRAKWLLISELKMSEPDAHRYIEKQAMDRCVSKRVIAEEIVKTYS